MKLFLDASVLLAAAGSAKGASRALWTHAPAQSWNLRSSPYAVNEVLRNLDKLPASATSAWLHLRCRLTIVEDVVTLDRAVSFAAGKDRPILFTALAFADVLTLDRKDFAERLGTSFFGLEVMLPSEFLRRERLSGRLSIPPDRQV